MGLQCHMRKLIQRFRCPAGVQLIACVTQAQEGKMVLAGALAEPVDSALFIWKDSTAEARTYRCHFQPSIHCLTCGPLA